jgi:hypothetical protein
MEKLTYSVTAVHALKMTKPGIEPRTFQLVGRHATFNSNLAAGLNWSDDEEVGVGWSTLDPDILQDFVCLFCYFCCLFFFPSSVTALHVTSPVFYPSLSAFDEFFFHVVLSSSLQSCFVFFNTWVILAARMKSLSATDMCVFTQCSVCGYSWTTVIMNQIKATLLSKCPCCMAVQALRRVVVNCRFLKSTCYRRLDPVPPVSPLRKVGHLCTL